MGVASIYPCANYMYSNFSVGAQPNKKAGSYRLLHRPINNAESPPEVKLLQDANPLFGPNEYRQVSNIRRTFVGNQIVDHSDVVGASPVGAAPTTSSFST